MDGMVSFHASYPKAGLPEVSDDFKITRELLTKGEFNLAVCGKVKNGKSSLINALIGKELLPVCNDVATSRVFKISNSDKEEFLLFTLMVIGNLLVLMNYLFMEANLLLIKKVKKRLQNLLLISKLIHLWIFCQRAYPY